jgi:hypothetical protein
MPPEVGEPPAGCVVYDSDLSKPKGLQVKCIDTCCAKKPRRDPQKPLR